MLGVFVRAGAFLFVGAVSALADEGMWLFNKPPIRQVRERYGFEITQDWLDHLQRSSVHMGGGSGSFVSGDGLVLTNHHVGAGTLDKLSTPERNYLADGFQAATRAEELRCPGMELRVLVNIEDVTPQVNAAVAATKTPEAGAAARREAMARIERESLAATGLRSEVVTLYRGGAYHLYRYKRYMDVRLVFAPERQAGAFGGDPDNFEFPRHCLDLCFFRVYENGEPAKTPDRLRWSTTGATEGELIFVSGHPGHTSREITYAELVSDRDEGLPYRLDRSLRKEALLSNWAARGLENGRRAGGAIVGIQNGRKATHAKLEGLLDPAFMAEKAAAEKKLRGAFLGSTEWKSAAAALDEIAATETSLRKDALRRRLLEGADGFDTGLFSLARMLLRAAEERPKPDGERLREFRDAGRAQLELGLFATRPIYKDLETEKLTESLTFLCGALGADDPLVVRVMAGKPPRERAAALVVGTKLEDPALRRALYEGDKAALDASTDPMIALARLVDGESRVLRQQSEVLGESMTQASQRIALGRFAIEGDGSYPDATMTLRLAYGTVKGYETEAGKVPWCTTLGGLLEKSAAQQAHPPYEIPATWEGKTFAKETPFNFISTADIIGGNSGSPVVNTKGELVGLIFDGNAANLMGDYGYTEKTARSVSVHSAGMLEALRKIYGAERLVEEILRE